MIEIDFSKFDSEVIELINDLNLVLKVSPEGRDWWSRWLASRYRMCLCDRYSVYQEEKRRDQLRLLNDLYKRNRKYSRFSYDSLDYQLTLFDDVYAAN